MLARLSTRTRSLTVLLLAAALSLPGLSVADHARAAGLLQSPVALQGAPDPAAAYRGQVSCDPVAKPGAVALRSMVLAYYGIGRDGGITRACNLAQPSEHQEGRAWDWMLAVANPAQKAAGDDFVLWLTGPDAQGQQAGNARRLGVMYVIWNRQIWSANRSGGSWSAYTGASPHTDHVHVSLSWDGAFQRTSWWTGTAITAQDIGPCQVWTGEFAPAYSGPRYTACPAAVPRPTPRASSASLDLDGDGRVDTVGREAATGLLWFYPGDGTGVPTSRRVVGSGWGMHDQLVLTPDVTGDGVPDLYARDAAQGRLWLYPGDGRGGFSAPTVVGTGWGMHDLLLAAGDVTGDGRPDLWARERGTGRLYLYPGAAGGVPTAPRVVGSGWSMHDTLLAPGDVTGDGVADLWAREVGTGTLWLYAGDGQGGFASRAAVGSGWAMHDVLTASADVTGDGRPDLVGRQRSDGSRWVYPTDATGVPTTPRAVGSGWQMHDALL